MRILPVAPAGHRHARRHAGGMLLIAALLSPLAVQADAGPVQPRPITNVADLVAQLAAGPAVTLTPIQSLSGCGPKGCAVDLEQVTVARSDENKPGVFQSATGGKIRLVEHRPADGRALPDMEWTPLRAFEVRQGQQRWGSCIEFTHEGLGKSGIHQRWTSVVLVPFKGKKPGTTAHRFVGYWAACESLRGSDKPDTVTLPLLEPTTKGAPQPLRLMQFDCSREACTGREDARVVRGDPTSETGQLTLDAAR